jgi:hypothetical protein
VAYVFSIISLISVPLHFYFSCRQSQELAGIAISLCGMGMALCFFAGKGTPNRFRPLLLSFVALILHSLSIH